MKKPLALILLFLLLAGLTWPALALNQQAINAVVRLGQPGLNFRYDRTFGKTQEPYLTDAYHLNAPNGLFIDQSDALYVVEERGYRLLKYSSSGQSLLTIGHAGDPLDYESNNTGLNSPKDVAVDDQGHIWVVMGQALKEFDAAGNLIQVFPGSDYWEWGVANDRFRNPRSLTFDSTGRLYVSDTDNHRIQVYTFTVASGVTPVYSATIGLTSVWTTTNAGFNSPRQIAFDSSDRLYVIDADNQRVQRCQFVSGWICTPFIGETGVPGDDLAHLRWPAGLTIDPTGNLYLADTGNLRVLKCTLAGQCARFAGVTGQQGTGSNYFWAPADIAVDSSGYVYISDYGNHRIQKFSSAGAYLSTLGVTRTPYLVDTSRLNSPWGIALTGDGGMVVTENGGYRLIKLNGNGVQQWTIGQAGAYGSDNTRLGAWWCGPEGSPAVDSLGRIYVPDTCNDRVQIFQANGSYLATLGSSGSGPGQFWCPAGVALHPVNGDIYVVDKCNQRIQVFTADRAYKTMLGVTGTAGGDNVHFNNPRGLAVDSAGAIYVADTDNHRVQKCVLNSSTHTCTTFVGEMGPVSRDFARLHPLAVAIDTAGRIYVVDEWNNRIQVFDSNGAYLTTVAGAWGPGQDQLISPSGVTVDNGGNVYVVDRYNHRLQRFASGVPEWEQKNINGFGEVNNGWLTEMTVWHGYLYAAVSNWVTGVQVWRSPDGVSWSQVNNDGFGSAHNTAIYGLVEFGGYLYIGTANQTAGGQIWRCQQCDGSDWVQISAFGLGDTDNEDTQPGIVLNNFLYVDTANRATGCEVWRSPNGTSWQQINPDGFGDANNWACTWQRLFNGAVYVGTYNDTNGGELWRYDGVAWQQVGGDGFGDANNHSIVPLITFQGYLYAGAWNDTSGAEIWRSADGLNWIQSNNDGFGKANNSSVSDFMATIFDNELYVGVVNQDEGMEIWKTSSGLSWSQVAGGGFGDSNNNEAPAPLVVFNNRLYVGTSNPANGTEVWQYARQSGSDAYEPDDSCAWASTLSTSGEIHAHTFHAQGDQDWSSFEAVAGTTYTIQAASTSDGADLVLELYNFCGGNPAYADDNAFGRSASVTFTAPTTGLYYLKTLNHTPTIFGAAVTYELSARRRTPEGVALIVAGHDNSYRYQNQIINAANLAYRTFRKAGISPGSIRYLSAVSDIRTDADDDGVSDVYASSASVNVQTALTGWLPGLLNSQKPFYLYLVDHGGHDTFLADGSSDTITAAELNDWLVTLETATGAPVNVIYEACLSGTFIEGTQKISRPGRVIITSTGKENNAYANPEGGAYFSDAFFTSLGQNSDLYTAFQAGSAAVRTTNLWQTPWLDDNGDGAPNTLGDGGLARTRGLISPASLNGRPPVVDEVLPLVNVQNGRGEIQARVRDDIGLSRVWAMIYPPSFVEPPPASDGIMPDLNLPPLDLNDNDGDGLYTAEYKNFTEPGQYRLVVYAEDDEGNLSQPGLLAVNIAAQSVYLPVVIKN